jgi:hypothetical protein
MAKDMNEEHILLVEMATVCSKRMGFGFIGIIYSNDHDPPHMHICDLDKKELGQIYLNPDVPQSSDDIVTYKGNVNGVKKNIVKWANSKDNMNFNNWLGAIYIWNTYQEDQIK